MKKYPSNSPEAMAPICGIPAETLREVAREFATTKSAMILWGRLGWHDNAWSMPCYMTCSLYKFMP